MTEVWNAHRPPTAYCAAIVCLNGHQSLSEVVRCYRTTIKGEPRLALDDIGGYTHPWASYLRDAYHQKIISLVELLYAGPPEADSK